MTNIPTTSHKQQCEAPCSSLAPQRFQRCLTQLPLHILQTLLLLLQPVPGLLAQAPAAAAAAAAAAFS
jgi:hypothetical protein